MASKKAANSHGHASAKVKPLPKGFVPARQRLDGFFAREPGNSITGVLRGSFQVKGKFGLKNVYRIELTDGQTQVGEDGEVVSKGGVVGVDETGYTKVLGELEPGTGVFVRYEGKEDEDNQRSPHVFSVGKVEG
jgi:hypothetical protein